MLLGAQWLGFLNVFHMVSNTFTIQLAHSRDRRNWHRVAPGRTWLDRGSAGSWEQFMVSISSPPVVVDDQMWVCYGGAKLRRVSFSQHLVDVSSLFTTCCFEDWFGLRGGTDHPSRP